MALLPSDKRATILLLVALLFVIVGTSLVYHATYDDKFKTDSPPSLRYQASYFYFLWISAFVTTSFQRPILMAITAGLLCAIFVFSFSLSEIDRVRITLNRLKVASDDWPSGAPIANPYEDPLRLLRQVAGGVILGYIGSGLAFIASVLVFRRANKSTNSRQSLLAALIVLFGFIGCILLWSSRDIKTQFNAGDGSVTRLNYGEQFFDITDGTVAVLVVFVVGIIWGITPLIYVSAFLAAFYNLSSLSTYLAVNKDLLESENQTCAGVVFCWLSALFMVFYCAFEEGSPDTGYDGIGTDSHA
eukprot:m.222719 g.222719  ORF g.222719 m.222719 type:complete len:302 (-) comp16086_c0_seq1:79-984(-)